MRFIILCYFSLICCLSLSTGWVAIMYYFSLQLISVQYMFYSCLLFILYFLFHVFLTACFGFFLRRLVSPSAHLHPQPAIDQASFGLVGFSLRFVTFRLSCRQTRPQLTLMYMYFGWQTVMPSDCSQQTMLWMFQAVHRCIYCFWDCCMIFGQVL